MKSKKEAPDDAISATKAAVAEGIVPGGGGVVVARMLEGKGNYGFDAARKEYVDLVEAGIIDPAKVVRVALENAVSVASMLLLTEATMTEIPEEKKDSAREAEIGM